jgi:Tol biopolymer transport system component
MTVDMPSIETLASPCAALHFGRANRDQPAKGDSMLFRTTFVLVAVACVGGSTATSAQTQQSAPSRATVQVTSDPGVDIDPVLSRDAKYVIYASSRSSSLELWMRPLGGGALFQLTSSVNQSADRNPALTADGATVVFQSDRVSGTRNIWAMDLKTRSLMQLTNTSDGASNPDVSSKGEVCYTRSYEDGRLAIWVMSLDGQNARELGLGLDCAWTPDGKQIVFSRNSDSRGDGQYDIWLMDSDGQNARVLLTTPDTWERAPVVSPDGKTVVFTQYESSFSSDLMEVQGGFQVRPGLHAALRSISLAGGARTELTDLGSFNSYASFSPDGGTIVFTSTRSGSADLWSIASRR